MGPLLTPCEISAHSEDDRVQLITVVLTSFAMVALQEDSHKEHTIGSFTVSFFYLSSFSLCITDKFR